MWKLNGECCEIIEDLSPRHEYHCCNSALKTQIIDDDDNREMPIECIYIGTLIVDR